MCAQDSTKQSPSARPAVLIAKRKINDLEEEFEQIVIRLFTLLSVKAEREPDFFHHIRTVLLAVPIKQTMKLKHASFFQAYKDVLVSATTVADYQIVICNYCNFLNVSLFEHLVEKLGEKELKTAFKLYMDHLCEFQAATKVGDFIDAQPKRKLRPPEFVEVEMKMNDAWEDQTMQDMEDFILSICARASLAPYEVYFMYGRRGSIVLVCSVAKYALSSLQLVLDEAGMAEYNIKAIVYAVLPSTILTACEMELTKELLTGMAASTVHRPLNTVCISTTPCEGNGASRAPGATGTALPDPTRLEQAAGELCDGQLWWLLHFTYMHAQNLLVQYANHRECVQRMLCCAVACT